MNVIAIPVFFLIGLFILTIFGLVIFLIIRAATRGPGVVVGGPPVASGMAGIGTQLGTDGFWVFSCPHDPGSILHYHYWANGVRRGGKVPYEPGPDGRQFVYTGERPECVNIVQVEEFDDPGILVVPPPIIVPEVTIWESGGAPSVPPPAPSFSGFPSAY